MSILTAKKVGSIFEDCLLNEEEMLPMVNETEGIHIKVKFNPERIRAYKSDILELLDELPDEFKESGGGGWTFMRMCLTKNSVQWGEHYNAEQLLLLGIAIEVVKIRLPRQIWAELPGGVPYITINI